MSVADRRRLPGLTVLLATLLASGGCSTSDREYSVEAQPSAAPSDVLVHRSFELGQELADLASELTLTSVPLFEDMGGFLTTAGLAHGDPTEWMARPQIDLGRSYDVLPDGMDMMGGNQLTVQASAPVDGDGYCNLALRFSFAAHSRLAEYEPLTVDTVVNAFAEEPADLVLLDVGVSPKAGADGLVGQRGATYVTDTGEYQAYDGEPLDAAGAEALTATVDEVASCVLDGIEAWAAPASDDAAEDGPAAVDESSLLNLRLPEQHGCTYADEGFAGARLVEGYVESARGGFIEVVQTLVQDLDGDGMTDGVAHVACSSGASGTSSSVFYLLAASPGSKELPYGADAETRFPELTVQRASGLSVDAEILRVTALAHTVDDAGCCPSAELELVYDLTADGPRFDSVRQVAGPGG